MSNSNSFVLCVARLGQSPSTLVLHTIPVLVSRMAEAGDSTTTNGSKSISLADILDIEAEEIGSRKLVSVGDEHADDDENALSVKPGREGFCVECEGASCISRSTISGSPICPVFPPQRRRLILISHLSSRVAPSCH
jgi:hypothetical protein